MPPQPKPPTDRSRLPAQPEEEGSPDSSAAPNSLRQLAAWRAQALARRSFGPSLAVPRKKR
jgi:hypothetical protein